MKLYSSSSMSSGTDKNSLDASADPAVLNQLKSPVHFIGIGGIGMSALARILLARGYRVTGSDKAASLITEELSNLGASIFIGHKADNIKDAATVVISTAIIEDNPELAQAKVSGLTVLHRSDLLNYLSCNFSLISISGTHGKTTTTGMVAQILLDAKLDPSVVVGGIFAKFAANAYSGKGKYFVAEADESDGTHAKTHSFISVITNIEADHLENYPGGFEQILTTMSCFANQSERSIILCLDDPGCRKLLPLCKKPVITYGSSDISNQADYVLKTSGTDSFSVIHKKKKLGEIMLCIPGKHNKLNALAGIVVALELGIDFNTIKNSLAGFQGVERRFQILGEENGVLVVDDYGHHPTEVAATLEAARQYQKNHNRKGRIIALFQPHQPGRLRDLWQEFCQCFTNADVVYISDIYVARGKQIEGITSERFVKEIRHHDVHYLDGTVNKFAEKLVPLLKQGDIVLTIGAGDVTTVGKPLLDLLKKRH